MKLLHLCHDEKFIPFVQRLYEIAYPGSNTFRVWGPRPGHPFRFVKAGERVKAVPKSYWFSRALRWDLENCDVLVVHMLNSTLAHAVRAAPPRVLVFWSAFGGDYYGLLDGYRQSLTLSASRRIDEIATRRESSMNLADLAGMILRSPARLVESIENRRWMERTIGRFELFNSDRYGYELLKQSQQRFRAERLAIPYYCVEDLGNSVGGDDAAPNILLGNSATATNNHVEALSTLAEMDIQGRQVICPLSYGSRTYADYVVRVGTRRLGSAFVPLRDFMPLDQYSKVISSCGVVVMNHVRAQALGNIIAALWSGSRLFLRPENHFLPHMKSFGAVVHEWSDVATKNVLAPLDSDERRRNRDAMQRVYGFDRCVEAAHGLRRLRIDEAFEESSGHAGTRSAWSLMLWAYNWILEAGRQQRGSSSSS